MTALPTVGSYQPSVQAAISRATVTASTSSVGTQVAMPEFVFAATSQLSSRNLLQARSTMAISVRSPPSATSRNSPSVTQTPTVPPNPSKVVPASVGAATSSPVPP